MNLVEVWFGVIERQAIHRGSFGSVKDLNVKDPRFVDGWTSAATPSSGPRPPTRSSPKRSVQQLLTQATRSDTPIEVCQNLKNRFRGVNVSWISGKSCRAR